MVLALCSYCGNVLNKSTLYILPKNFHPIQPIREAWGNREAHQILELSQISPSHQNVENTYH
jgi:hypothetical protein